MNNFAFIFSNKTLPQDIRPSKNLPSPRTTSEGVVVKDVTTCTADLPSNTQTPLAQKPPRMDFKKIQWEKTKRAKKRRQTSMQLLKPPLVMPKRQQRRGPQSSTQKMLPPITTLRYTTHPHKNNLYQKNSSVP